MGQAVRFRDAPPGSENGPAAAAAASSRSRDNDHQESSPPPPSLEVQAFLLAAPLLIFRVATLLAIPAPLVWFCSSAFVAIRQVVLLHLGLLRTTDGPEEEPDQVIGPVTCRFSVDLKGVLRYISNRKEEREEFGEGTEEVSVVHIVASAVARALKKNEGGRLLLNKKRRRRIRVPLLLIDGVAAAAGDASKDPVSVSVVSKNAGGVATVSRADERSVQEIADELANDRNLCTAASKRELGQCLVLASPNYDETEMHVDAAPIHPNVAVVVVVGGVHLARRPHLRSSSGSGGGKSSSNRGPKRPVISVSLTIAGPHRASGVAMCGKFTEEVQKLIEFPEMCDS